MPTPRTLVSLTLLLCLVAARSGAAEDERGRELYRPCIACHGPAAEGNSTTQAPALAGLPEWYVARQLENFRSGRRGSEAADIYGAQMARMAEQLWDSSEVRSVAAHVASLPPAPSVATIDGKAKRGEALYMSCAACHGPDAAGNAELGAPPLRALDDWYIVKQLNAFRAGLRGSHPDDAAGLTMRAAAATLADDADARDVTAYITTLRNGAARDSRRRR